MMHIGEKIKQRRKELKWSQRDLADRMEYAHSTIGRIERGIIDIPQSRIAQFSEVLGVPVSYLMDWEEKPTAQGSELSEGMMELVDCIKKLPEDKIQMLLQVARSIR